MHSGKKTSHLHFWYNELKFRSKSKPANFFVGEFRLFHQMQQTGGTFTDEGSCQLGNNFQNLKIIEIQFCQYRKWWPFYAAGTLTEGG
jgi:hypothetical protein